MSSQATQSPKVMILKNQMMKSHWCQSAMSMRLMDQTAGTHAMAITTAQAIESARSGAGAMGMTTVTERASQPLKKSAPSTRVRTIGDAACAGTPWTAKVTEPAHLGAIARANQTADLRMS